MESIKTTVFANSRSADQKFKNEKQKLKESRSRIESENSFVQSALALQQEQVIEKMTNIVENYFEESFEEIDNMFNGDLYQANLHPSSSYGGTIHPLFQVIQKINNIIFTGFKTNVRFHKSNYVD